MSHLNEAIALARDASPPPLDAERLDEMMATAHLARRIPVEPRAPRRRVWAFGGAAAAALVLLVAGYALSADESSPRPVSQRRETPNTGLPNTGLPNTGLPNTGLPNTGISGAGPGPMAIVPTYSELPDGDRVSATPGANYAVRGTRDERVLDVRVGGVLVDARPRTEGQQLRVQTPHGAVRVVGTVFSVRVDDAHTVVRVYEGRVVVTSESDAIVLGAGGQIRVGPDGFTPAPERDAEERALSAEAADAIRRRHHAPAGANVSGPDATEAQGVASRPANALTPSPAVHPTTRRPPRPAFARLWIADRQPERALAAAQQAIDAGEHEATWRMVEAEALRALERPGPAVVAYERAASLYGPALAARAALQAARLRLDALGDRTGARRTLDRYGVSAEPGVARSIAALRERIDAAP